ncbi:hypothetical protein WICPIJ_002719 [Wickerhamomyces pijperi]|uniref:Uncharacterized protein n=1 Tax=Wickerhamomyces pijperi TaxID=599730 RepID=A0A9P8Q8K0_WICPI|nr:hypothetical protein WICPIJ_002719 [Wickerhamomyces pijperi]
MFIWCSPRRSLLGDLKDDFQDEQHVEPQTQPKPGPDQVFCDGDTVVSQAQSQQVVNNKLNQWDVRRRVGPRKFLLCQVANDDSPHAESHSQANGQDERQWTGVNNFRVVSQPAKHRGVVDEEWKNASVSLVRLGGVLVVVGDVSSGTVNVEEQSMRMVLFPGAQIEVSQRSELHNDQPPAITGSNDRGKHQPRQSRVQSVTAMVEQFTQWTGLTGTTSM